MFFKLLNKMVFFSYSFFGRVKAAQFKSCGSNLVFWGFCKIKNMHLVELGDNVSINDNVYINALGGVVIGDNVALSAGSMLISTGLVPESLNDKKTHFMEKIIIGNNVQIGAGAIILPGIVIGNNVIVGAGSIVTKDIDSDSVVAGNPAKLIRKI